MKFTDFDIDSLNLTDVDDFSKLIVYYLCCESDYLKELDANKRVLLEKIIKFIA